MLCSLPFRSASIGNFLLTPSTARWSLILATTTRDAPALLAFPLPRRISSVRPTRSADVRPSATMAIFVHQVRQVKRRIFMAATDSETNNPLVSLSRRMADAVERVSSSIVAVDARPRVRTSGVLWREGIIVSTSHTVRRDEEITVTLHDGREVRATLAGRDAGTDLAVLRVEDNGGDDAKATANTPAQFTDASELKVGTLVLAVGRAVPERGVAASFGIVGHLGDKWHTWRGGAIDRLVPPDVSIFIGLSGGALVDVEGHIVGVNTTGLARGTGLT